jgi:putative transposase
MVKMLVRKSYEVEPRKSYCYYIPMKKPAFVSNEFYHIYNRGVEKRSLFLNNEDRFRFIHDLYEFNDEESAENIYYRQKALQSYEVQPHKILYEWKPLVEILAFCLMPNHFHLLLKQHTEHGIVRFMQKLGTGYTMYFNQSHERVGALFQGRFKAVHIDTDRHLFYLPHYIHANPLELSFPSWENRRTTKKNISAMEQFLSAYRWSSYPDYIGIRNVPSLLSFLMRNELFQNETTYRKEFQRWLRDHPIENIADVAIDS